MRAYTIVARVRSRGAIGIFYPLRFEVDAVDAVDARRAWFELYGSTWELEHFVSVTDRGEKL